MFIRLVDPVIQNAPRCTPVASSVSGCKMSHVNRHICNIAVNVIDEWVVRAGGNIVVLDVLRLAREKSSID